MKRHIFTLGVVLLVAIGLGATACSKKPPASPSQAPSPQSSNNANLNKTKSDYTQALSKAKGWQGNATLARVYRQYKGTLTPAEPVPTTFSFASLAEPTKSFQVEFTDKNLKENKVAKPPFELTFSPINVADWQVDPDRALAIAEENGGKRFREIHLAGYKVLVQLAKVGKYPLQWYVRYDTDDGSHLRYEVYIDAKTGEIDQKRERPA